MADFDVQLMNVAHSELVFPGAESSVSLDVFIDTPFLFTEFNPDACSRYLVLVGVDLGISVLVDGEERGHKTDCAPQDAERSYIVPYDAPEEPGHHSLTVEFYGRGSGEVVTRYESAIEVADPDPIEPDPEYDVTVASPASVEQGEEFRFDVAVECLNADCPETGTETVVANERIESGVIQLDAGEVTNLAYGPDEMWINDPGEHTISYRLGDSTGSDEIVVTERDPDISDEGPIPEDPDRSGTGINRTLLAAAFGAGAVVADTPDDPRGGMNQPVEETDENGSEGP